MSFLYIRSAIYPATSSVTSLKNIFIIPNLIKSLQILFSSFIVIGFNNLVQYGIIFFISKASTAEFINPGINILSPSFSKLICGCMYLFPTFVLNSTFCSIHFLHSFAMDLPFSSFLRFISNCVPLIAFCRILSLSEIAYVLFYFYRLQ